MWNVAYIVCCRGTASANVQLFYIAWVRDFEYLLRVLVFTSYTFACYEKKRTIKTPVATSSDSSGWRTRIFTRAYGYDDYVFYLFVILNRFSGGFSLSLSHLANNRSSHASSVEHIFTLSRTCEQVAVEHATKSHFFLYWMEKEMKEILNVIMGSLRLLKYDSKFIFIK